MSGSAASGAAPATAPDSGAGAAAAGGPLLREDWPSLDDAMGSPQLTPGRCIRRLVFTPLGGERVGRPRGAPTGDTATATLALDELVLDPEDRMDQDAGKPVAELRRRAALNVRIYGASSVSLSALPAEKSITDGFKKSVNFIRK